jgi:carnitine O-acetyltransferase
MADRYSRGRLEEDSRSISTRSSGDDASGYEQEEDDGGVTFANQLSLPRLPIPTLHESLNKFLDFLEPLQDKKEQELAQQVVFDFLKHDGPKLQDLLTRYEQEGTEMETIGSYVEEFWNESDLAPDQSVVLNLNPFFVLEDGPDPKIAKDPLRRAASLTFCAIKLASSIRDQTLLPDTHKGKPLCMDQFKAVFGTARVPNLEGDEIDVYPNSSHVAVISRHQMYYFQALWPDGAVAVEEEDIVDILEAVQRNSINVDPNEASRNFLGVLTSLGRRQWALARRNLAAIPMNEEYLCIVDSALFVLVLDDYIPKDFNDAAANMLHGSYELKKDEQDSTTYQAGSCLDRWYDKLQIIVCGDGTAGINFDHSAIDGHTALRVVSDIYAETVVSFAQSITKTVHAHATIPNVIEARIRPAASLTNKVGQPTLDTYPKKVDFTIPDSIKESIVYAEAALGDQIMSSDTVVLEFNDYGKMLIVGNNLSPDAYVQMSMMLAFYKLYGKVVCAYEPVLTKQFYHGRTEAMRSATPQAKELCQIMFDGKAPNRQKMAALRRATQVHTQCVSESARGKGVDRHLFALKCIAERNKLPSPFFESVPWKLLNHTILSTSNCGNSSLRLFGFGPVVADGFGIGYIIKDNSIHYSVSSKHRQTQRYVNELRDVLMEMSKLLKRTGMAAVGRRHRANSIGKPVDQNGGGILEENGHTPGKPALKKDPPPADRWLDISRHKPFVKPVTKVPTSLQKASVAPQDGVPCAPTRRGSLFTGYTRRASMDSTRLAQSGTALNLGSAELDKDKGEDNDEYNDDDSDLESKDSDLEERETETDSFGPSNHTFNSTSNDKDKFGVSAMSFNESGDML